MRRLALLQGVAMRDRCYFTYIMASRSHNFYVGVTSNMLVRAWQHREGVFEGFAKRYCCNRLVWFEASSSIYAAIAREKQLKGWRRSKKIGLIERENPAWVDLSEGWGEVMGSMSFSG